MIFTYDAYKKMLHQFQEAGYKFINYSAVVDPPWCMLRHDLDIDPDLALPLAKIESDCGVSSTYCVMLSSSAYNVLSPEVSEVISKILSMGHTLGLHFSCDSYPHIQYDVPKLSDAVSREAEILSDRFGSKVGLVSFHRPNHLVLSGNPDLSRPIPHSYERKYLKEAKYFADSGGFFRFGHPLDSEAFQDRRPIVLCCHPVWWASTPQSPIYALKSVVAKKRDVIKQYLMSDVLGV